MDRQTDRQMIRHELNDTDRQMIGRQVMIDRQINDRQIDKLYTVRQ